VLAGNDETHSLAISEETAKLAPPPASPQGVESAEEPLAAAKIISKSSCRSTHLGGTEVLFATEQLSEVSPTDSGETDTYFEMVAAKVIFGW